MNLDINPFVIDRITSYSLFDISIIETFAMRLRRWWCSSNMAISSQLSENRCVCEMSMSDVLYTLCIYDIYFSASIAFYIFRDVLQWIADVPMHICESLCECVWRRGGGGGLCGLRSSL